jgi:hypothetical protein
MSFRACEIKGGKNLSFRFAFHICMPCIWVLRYIQCKINFRVKYKRDLFRSLGFNLFHLFHTHSFWLFAYTESTTCLLLIPYKNLLFTSHVISLFEYDKHSNPLFNGFVAHFNMARFEFHLHLAIARKLFYISRTISLKSVWFI